ncbi:hypothetical protein B1H38_09435 [Leptospira borgpetersenii serovar Ballum]|nr:hypothetical protein B1H38_09435 [Leptospira borgpetersenii serovar Ballum]
MVIYGFSNGFYCWNALVRILRFWDKLEVFLRSFLVFSILLLHCAEWLKRIPTRLRSENNFLLFLFRNVSNLFFYQPEYKDNFVF